MRATIKSLFAKLDNSSHRDSTRSDPSSSSSSSSSKQSKSSFSQAESQKVDATTASKASASEAFVVKQPKAAAPVLGNQAFLQDKINTRLNKLKQLIATYPGKVDEFTKSVASIKNELKQLTASSKIPVTDRDLLIERLYDLHRNFLKTTVGLHELLLIDLPTRIKTEFNSLKTKPKNAEQQSLLQALEKQNKDYQPSSSKMVSLHNQTVELRKAIEGLYEPITGAPYDGKQQFAFAPMPN